MLRRTTVGAALCVGALTVAAVAVGAAPVGAAPTATTAPPQPSATVVVDDPSGSARTVRTAPGHPLARPSGLTAAASSTTVATTLVRSLSAQLGTAGDTFAPKSVRRSSAGGDVVRLQQTVSGVPVLGGEVVVDLDPTGSARSVHSETLPSAAPSTTARVTSALATTRALAAVVLSTKARPGDLRASTPSLAIYDPRIFGAPGVQRATLVWQTTVRSTTDRGIDHLVLVDATRGFVTLDLDQLGRATTFPVCDADGQAANVPCMNPLVLPGVFAPEDDANRAAAYASATYDFYLSYLGRDSVDAKGMPLVSTVRYCPPVDPPECPYQNAFWDDTVSPPQMVYGKNFPQADDVVAHELTHGVTQFDSGLFYYFQSGAINESLSDIFGEYLDQTNVVAGTKDGTQYDWEIGEDLPTGPLRDMADPTINIGGFSQPDRMSSPFYEVHTNAGSDQGFDSGGVHGNSGVGNKLGYLLGSDPNVNAHLGFNGQTITPLGIPKAARIIYEASLLLTSGADYRALASALRTSCSTLIGVAPLQPGATVTIDDCAQVDKAILATEMDQVPVKVPRTDAPFCPAGTARTTTFQDDMETASSGNWVRKGGFGVSWDSPFATGSGALWFYGSRSNPYGATQQYATSGVDNLWGDDPDLTDAAVFSAAPATYDGQIVSKPLKVPAGTSYVRFEHAFGFDSEGGAASNHDGGRVEYTVNAGASWSDAGPLFTDNGYGFNTGGVGNSKFAQGNPLHGAAGFTRHSQGYVASRINLSSLAGRTVQLRFRIVGDQVVGDYGWFVDDVRLYACGPLVVPSVPASVVFGPTALTWPATDVTASVTSTYQLATKTPGGALGAYGAENAAPSRSVVLPVVKGGGTTCVRVIGRQSSPVLASSALRCITLPADDAALARRGSWTRPRSVASFGRSVSLSKTLGATLTLPSARGTHLVIVANRLVRGGSVGVYVKGKRVALVSLSTTGSTKYKQLVDLKLAGLTGVPVVLRVETSGRYVAIDGVAVRP